MEVISLITLGLLGKKLIDLAKDIRAKDIDGALTMLTSFLVGILLVVAYVHSDFSVGQAIGGLVWHNLNGAAQVLAGLNLGAAMASSHDVLATFDSNQSSATPKLFKG